jgi:tetratricopeptide (TPR) repeat protein
MRLALLILFASAVAIAGPDPKAAAHYKQGKAFLDSKQYDQAIVEFQAAYAIDKVPSHLYNIAKAYEAKTDHDKTIEYYQKYLDADPTTKLAAEVRNAIANATAARDAAKAKQAADEEAARLAAKKRDAAARVKQAEAFEQAGAWNDAGKEHEAAFGIDGDPTHLIAAAEAYRKAPDLKAARDAYVAYLGKVPQGGDSDQVRTKLAETTKAIEKEDADERERLRKEQEAKQRIEQPPKIEYDTSARDARRGVALKVAIPGAVVTLAGLGLGFKALSDKNKAKDNNCDDFFVCTDEGANKIDSAQSQARIADIIIGLGLAATITGVVLWVGAPEPVEKVKVVPTASPAGAGVTLMGRF